MIIIHTINKERVKQFYEETKAVWPKDDLWHSVNQYEIKKAVHDLRIPYNSKILNAGSGGSTYGLTHDMYHLDIVANKNVNLRNFTLGSVENIPFNPEFFDYVICVGSVLNYCDAVQAIQQFSRVLKTGGILLLEFECSTSFEFIGTKVYNKNAALIITRYFNKEHEMWVFSPKYIQSMLITSGFSIKGKHNYHILSSLDFHFRRDEQKAAKLAKCDKLFRQIPIIRNHCGNIILVCVKN